MLASVSARNLLKTYGSPLYVYDWTLLNTRCTEFKYFCQTLENALNGISVNAHYSTKANSNPTILSAVKQAGINVDCMSPFELAINKKVGFSKDKMLYVCNNISPEEMQIVHDEGLLICLDSLDQVDTWGQLFPNTEIMIRINPGTYGVGHSDKVVTAGKATKFGICEDNFASVKQIAERHSLSIIGIHQHLGSLFLNDKIDTYINGVKSGLLLIKKYFPDVKIVDLGGGFGVPYKPDEKRLDLILVANKLIPILKSFTDSCKNVTEIKFEPGRYIPCESGKLFGTVTAVKYENETYWIGTDIGMNQLVRPSMYDSYHEIKILTDPKSCFITANICGNVCESGDILGKERIVPIPKVGDPVVVYNSGAYGYSMASNYTGRLRPAEIVIYPGDEPKLIRKRESIDDLMDLIVF